QRPRSIRAAAGSSESDRVSHLSAGRLRLGADDRGGRGLMEVRPGETAGRPKLAVFTKGFIDDLVARRMKLSTRIELGVTLDVDGIEMYPAFMERDDPTYRRAVRRQIEEAGLTMPMLCHSPDFTRPSAAERRREIERAKAMIELTVELGGEFCR